jgi:hypothetical protein
VVVRRVAGHLQQALEFLPQCRLIEARLASPRADEAREARQAQQVVLDLSALPDMPLHMLGRQARTQVLRIGVVVAICNGEDLDRLT